VLLRGEDVRRFGAFLERVVVEEGDKRVIEHVLPYVNGRCQFLGGDDRCTIYEDRPVSCRKFECVRFFNARGVGAHERFLELNPEVLERLERM
jgi:Fe-S-cluster containining protein